MYAAMAQRAEKKNLAVLRTALRIEHDPLVRAMAADALYRSDPDGGGGALLEAVPPSPELFARLRSVTRELALPVPAVSSLLDLAVDGSAEAFARLLAFAPLSRAPQRDDAFSTALSDGLVEVADASAEEFLAAVRAAPADQAQALVELLAEGVSRADLEADETPVAQLLRAANPVEVPQAAAWLAVLEQRSVPTPAATLQDQSPAPAISLSQSPAVPVASSSLGPDLSVNARQAAAAAQATAAALEAAAAAKAVTTTVPATFSPRPAEDDRWPVTTIPNPGWPRTAPVTQGTSPAPAVPAASTAPQAPDLAPACTPEPQSCSARPPDASRPGG
jgi:hypothetical protein